MTRAWKKNHQRERRVMALENLQKAKFFDKNGRTPEKWRARVEQEISILKNRI